MRRFILPAILIVIFLGAVVALLSVVTSHRHKKIAAWTPTPIPISTTAAPVSMEPTVTLWLDPLSATAKAAIEAKHPNVAYGTVITPEPQISKPSSSGGFETVNVGDFRIDYIGHKREKCFLSNAECVVIQYRFTNNSDKTTSFMLSIGRKAFQGGIQMEFSSAKDSELLTDIRPGSSINVKDSYELRNSDPVVELEFTPLFAVWTDPIKRTINLR